MLVQTELERELDKHRSLISLDARDYLHDRIVETGMRAHLEGRALTPAEADPFNRANWHPYIISRTSAPNARGLLVAYEVVPSEENLNAFESSRNPVRFVQAIDEIISRRSFACEKVHVLDAKFGAYSRDPSVKAESRRALAEASRQPDPSKPPQPSRELFQVISVTFRGDSVETALRHDVQDELFKGVRSYRESSLAVKRIAEFLQAY